MRSDQPHEEFRGTPVPFPWTVEEGDCGQLAVVTHDGDWHRVVVVYDADADGYTVRLEADDDHPHGDRFDEPFHVRGGVADAHLGLVVSAMTMLADNVDPFTNPHSRGYTDHFEAEGD